MGILEKYADRNWYDRHLDDFPVKLEAGQVSTKMLLPWDTYGSECVTCGESVIAFKYRGQRYDLHELGSKVIIHQCAAQHYEIGPEEGWPEPEYGERDDILEAQAEARGEIYPDDPEVRDGDGNIRSGGWSDPGTEPRSFADPVYGWPDIPYVDPTR